MPNDHVLRIADERRAAANVSTRRERDEIGQQRKLPASDHRDNQRRKH